MQARIIIGALPGILASFALSSPAHAGVLPGYGELSGTVSGSTRGVLPIVYAHNTVTNVRYARQ